MSLTTTDVLLSQVPAIAAFNAIQIEHAEAIIAGAEAARLPVILQFSENAVRYHGSLEPLGSALLALARSSSVPVAVHLDHAESEALVEEALELGFTSVMFDAAHSPYAENVSRTAAIVATAARSGAWVEAELGEIGGKDGAHAPGVRTDVAEAVRFVADTGVAGLAVAVGSSHAMTSRSASLDFDRIGELAASLPVPLVLHGSSGVSDADIATAIGRGMRKINIATHLNALFTDSVRTTLSENPAMTDTRKYLGVAREVVAEEVQRLVTLISAR